MALPKLASDKLAPLKQGLTESGFEECDVEKNELSCSSRRACQQNVPRFNRMEADLHNLFPSRSGTNRARSKRSFGEVANEPREFGTTCDFEVDTVNDVAEPPPDARGDVARAIFYMHQEYGSKGVEPGRSALNCRRHASGA